MKVIVYNFFLPQNPMSCPKLTLEEESITQFEVTHATLLCGPAI